MRNSSVRLWKRSGHATRLLVLAAFVALASSAACGSDDEQSPTLPDPGPDSGLDTEARIVDLSAEEVVMLCDWMAGRFGGYGRGIQCGDLGIASRQNQSLCVADWAGVDESCPLTVLDLESCINGTVDQEPCTELPSPCLDAIFCA